MDLFLLQNNALYDKVNRNLIYLESTPHSSQLIESMCFCARPLAYGPEGQLSMPLLVPRLEQGCQTWNLVNPKDADQRNIPSIADRVRRGGHMMSAGFHVLAEPAGAICNLDWQYCLYLSNEMLYLGDRLRMSNELLDSYIRQLLEAQPAGNVNVAWQGGEPTLMGVEFFRRVVHRVEQHRKAGQNVIHTIQTNGTELDDEWCRFFKQHNVLVGIGVDGPESLHDAYRVDRAGRGNFKAVMHGYELLRRHEVDVNILCTIHAANADHPLELYRFFRDELQARYLQLIPIVERTMEDQIPMANLGWGRCPGGDRPMYVQRGGQVTERSVRPDQFGRFLIAIFDEWVRRDVGSVFVQTFEVALGSWLGQHKLCIFSPTRGNAVAIEPNGDLYSCDHYIEPKYRVGDIRETPMGERVASSQQRAFGQNKLDSLSRYCHECTVLFACHGGCPRNRVISTRTAESGFSYLSTGYTLFFNHITPAMKTMANLPRQNRFADDILQVSHT
jgi:uncharacterized protein